MKNLYNFLLVCLCSFLSVTAISQSWSYVNTEEYFADANDVIEDATGNILICGGGGSWPFTADGNVRVTKIDALGNLLWEYEFTSPATIGAITANDIALASDGYVVFCSGFEKPLIIKLNTDGTLAWTSESWCSGLATSAISKAYGMVAADGSITMMGQSGYYDTFTIYKVAADGSLSDEINYPMSDGFFGSYNIVETWEGIATTDDGMAICGSIISSSIYCPFVWKFDSDGNEEWRSDLTTFDGRDAYGVTQTDDGGYAIISANPFGYNATLIKIDNTGAETWSQTYDATSSSYIPYAADVAQRTDGTYAVAINNYDNVFTYFGFADIIFADASGSEISRVTVAGGEETTNINSITATAEGGFAFCGHFGMDDYISGAWDSRYYAQKSSADGNLSECIYNCVWPGDADNSGTANTDDILAIGLGYGSIGDTRLTMGNDWFAHASNDWATTLPDGTNHKYTDCNGDGNINDDDTAAVALNYANSHALVSLKMDAAIPLYIEDPGVVLNGGPHELKIRLGDAANIVGAIYGLRFTLQFEGESIAAESVSIHFDNSWIGAETEMLQFKKLFADTYQIDVALVKTDLLNSNGYGDIGTLSFVLVDNIAGKENEMEELTFSIIDVRAIDIDMNDIEITGLVTNVNADATSVDETGAEIITIYPNPVSDDYLYTDTNYSLLNITLFDLTGKTVKEFSASEIASAKLSVAGITNGAYQLKIKTEQGTTTQKLLIAH